MYSHIRTSIIRLSLLTLLAQLTMVSLISQTLIQSTGEGKSTPVKTLIEPVRSFTENIDGSFQIGYKISAYQLNSVKEKNKEYKIPKIAGFGLLVKEGAPSLPSRTDKIILSSEKANVEIIKAEYIEIKNIEIYPMQPLPLDGPAKQIPFSRDAKLYATNAFYPSNIVKITEIQNLRGTPIASVQLCPVQYNPVTKTLRIYKSLQYKITGTGNKVSLASRSQLSTPVNTSLLSNIALNGNTYKKAIVASSQKSAPNGSAVGYLIITHSKYLNAAEKLATWKRQLGYKVEVYSQSTWTSGEVKTLIHNRYTNMVPTPSYFLLMGEYDEVPDEKLHNNYYNFDYYSSLPYACMDGSDDYYPEMANGRISITSEPQALKVVQKIIDYEKTPPSDVNFYKKALQAGYFESVVPGHEFYRYIHTVEDTRDYMKTFGYEVDRIYYTNPDVNPTHYEGGYFSNGEPLPAELLRENGFQWDGDKTDIVEAINEGRFYAFHRDHGLGDGWVNPNFDTTDLNNLHNGNKTPIVFSINCSTGMLHWPECFAEKMLRMDGGGVGIVAASEETISGFNDAFVIGMFDAIWSNPGILPNFGSAGKVNPQIAAHGPIYTMGDVINQGLIRMTETYNEDWANRRQFEMYHFFGDPTTMIFTGTPVQVTGSYNNLLNAGETNVNITSSNCTDGTATICFNNDLKGIVKLQNGVGTIALTEPIPENITNVTLTISGHNFIPLVTNIPVQSNVNSDTRIRIMPLGNSLTFDTYSGDIRPVGERASYRKALAEMLTELSVDFNFVGSEQSGGSVMSDPDNAGFPGIRSSGLLQLLKTGYDPHTQIQETAGSYLDTYLPDIILLHIGTNDNSENTDTLSMILDEIDAYKVRTGKQTKVILAKLVQKAPNSSVFTAYNDNINLLVNSRNNPNIILVDMPAKAGIIYQIDPLGDMHDAIHPNSLGYIKMAQVWLNGIGKALSISPDVPQLFNIQNKTVNFGEKISIDIQAIANEYPVFKLSGSPSPTVVFDSLTGTLKWTADVSGNFNLTVTAKNAGGSSQKTFSITVNAPVVVSSGTVGSTIIYNTTVYNNFRRAQKIIMPINGYLQKVSMYHGAGTGNVLYAVYSDASGMPGNLLSVTPVTATSNSKGWQEIALNTPVEASKDQILWLAWVYEQSPELYYDSGLPGRATSSETWGQQMPANFGSASVLDYTYSIYAVYSANNESTLPATPSNLSFVYDSLTPKVQLSWNSTLVNTENFEVQRSTNSGTFTTITTLPNNQFVYNDLVSQNTTYAYKIVGSNSVEKSAPSNTVTIYTSLTTVPAAPSELMANYIQANNKIHLTWMDNSANETGFIIEKRKAGESFAQLTITNNNITSYDDLSIDAETNYEYQVKAKNNVGNSNYAPIATVHSGTPALPTIPAEPSATSAQLLNTSIVKISWTDNSNNETGFIIKKAVGNGAYTTLRNVGVNTLSTNDTVQTLNQNYTYRIIAFNAIGKSDSTNSCTIFVPAAATKGKVGSTEIYTSETWISNRRAQQVIMPADGTLTEIAMYHGSGSGNVIYAVYSDNNGMPGTKLGETYSTLTASVTGWQELALKSSVPVTKNTKIWLAWTYQYTPALYYTTGTPGRAHTTGTWSDGMPTDFGSSAVADYKYSIYAEYNAVVQNPVPAAPTALSGIFNQDIPSITLNWTDNADNEVSFSIEKSIGAGAFSEVATKGSNQTNVTDNAIVLNETYKYRVKATNANGNSAYSNTFSIQTTYVAPVLTPTAPSGFTAVYNQITPSVQLNWTDNSSNESGFMLLRSLNSGSFETLIDLPQNQIQYTDNTINYLQNYDYKIYAYNSYGNSGYSNTVNVHTIQPGSDPIKVGITDILPITVLTAYRRAQQITITNDGQVTSIAMYHGASSGKLIYGVYSDDNGNPGTLLATTALTNNSSATGWQTVDLSTPLTVIKNQKIWLAWVFEQGTVVYYGDGTPGRAHSNQYYTGSLPLTFGSSTYTDYVYSIYINMTPNLAKNAEQEFSIQSKTSDPTVLIYPNPVNHGTLNIQVSELSESTRYFVQIMDLSGTVIKKDEMWLENEQPAQIDITGLQKSLYILRLSNGTDNISLKFSVAD